MNDMDNPEDAPDIADAVMLTLDEQRAEILEIQGIYDASAKTIDERLSMEHIHAWHVWAITLELRLPRRSIYPAEA